MNNEKQNSELNSHIFYLHGFASSPASTKAVHFKNMLEKNGASVSIPDLNFPSFKEMTLTTQLNLVQKQIDQISPDVPIILFGSSMGGLLSTLIAQNNSRVQSMVLLAPGFGITARWKEFLNQDEYDRWKQSGEHLFYHHAYDAQMPLGYDFAVDLERVQTDDLIVEIPCIVFHGEHDQTVPVEASKRFAALNRSVELRVLDDDHQLLKSIDYMLAESLKFLRSQQVQNIIG